MKRVNVVAGVLLDPTRALVLVARRRPEQHQGGLWEYPGGKCEAGEPELDALSRELDEELGIAVQSASHLTKVEHDYADKSVSLSFYVVTHFDGEPAGKEGQFIKWVAVESLQELAFPDANRPVSAELERWISRNSTGVDGNW